MEIVKGLVSIIIPSYNSEKFLEECLDSCIRQTYPQIEICFLDDKSTDESLTMAKRILQNSSRQYVIHENTENMGISATRNAGMKICRGEYLIFLDADDILAPDAVECMLNTLIEEKSDVVIANHVFFKESTSEMFSDSEDSVGRIDFSQMPYAWGILYRKNVVNILFDTTMGFAEDTHFNVRMSRFYPNVPFIHRKLYGYRVGHNKDSITAYARRTCKIISGFIILTEKMMELVTECNESGGGYRNTVPYRCPSGLPPIEKQCVRGNLCCGKKARI